MRPVTTLDKTTTSRSIHYLDLGTGVHFNATNWRSPDAELSCNYGVFVLAILLGAISIA
jgi:hypothetical protein